MFNLRLAMTYAIATTLLGGCVIKDFSDSEHECDDDWYDDYSDYDTATGAGTGTATGAGTGTATGTVIPGEGDPCSTNLDCNLGLICDTSISACVVEPTSCNANAECGPGCYCDNNLCTPSTVCSEQSDCGQGLICDEAYATCVPGTLACDDIETEQECSGRADCEPVYAGVDCSCGPNCACVGGEPGCVCDSFEFFQCEDL